MSEASDRRRLDALEGWRQQVERRHDLTEVVAFVEKLMDAAEYRDRFQTERQKVWRRWRGRLIILGITVGIVGSTINATISVLGH